MKEVLIMNYKNNLHKYVNEIILISNKHAEGRIEAGTEMFLNQITDAGKVNDQYTYEGTPGFDYGALKPALTDLKESKQDFFNVMKKYREEIAELYNDDDKEGLKELVMFYGNCK